MERKQSDHYNYTFGTLSAFGIIFVVLGHVKCNILAFDNWLPYYAFHMPLFAFISGYFYKSENEHAPAKYILKKVRTLLLPFFVWNLIYLTFQTVLSRWGFDIGRTLSLYNLFVWPWTQNQPIGFNVSSWFIIALFLTEMFNFLIRLIFSRLHITNENVILILHLVLTVLLVTYLRAGEVQGLWSNILRSVYLLFFYQLGHWYRVCGEARDTANHFVYFSVLIAVQMMIKFYYPTLTTSVFRCGELTEYPIAILEPVIGIAFWLRVARLTSAF
ncbi:MAG: acyltransferase family protein, partial [Hominenteromicrobium sp.]